MSRKASRWQSTQSISKWTQKFTMWSVQTAFQAAMCLNKQVKCLYNWLQNSRRRSICENVHYVTHLQGFQRQSIEVMWTFSNKKLLEIGLKQVLTNMFSAKHFVCLLTQFWQWTVVLLARKAHVVLDTYSLHFRSKAHTKSCLPFCLKSSPWESLH